jgi:uncharacterized protein YkwD
VAYTAHVGVTRRRSKRPHTTCRVATKRHHRHTRRCVKSHTTRTHARAYTVPPSSKRSSLAEAPASGRAKRSSEPGAIATIDLPNPEARIASVLSTPCQDTELMPEPANLTEVEAATLCLVNQERARNNELPLLPSAQLAQSSQTHSQDMISEDYFSHIAPNGETPLDRIEATGYIPNAQVGYTIGENIAWGTLSLATPSAIVAAWIASPEHLANVLNDEYRETAVGVYPAAPPSLAESQPGAVYTQEFGVITG